MLQGKADADTTVRSNVRTALAMLLVNSAAAGDKRTVAAILSGLSAPRAARRRLATIGGGE